MMIIMMMIIIIVMMMVMMNHLFPQKKTRPSDRTDATGARAIHQQEVSGLSRW